LAAFICTNKLSMIRGRKLKKSILFVCLKVTKNITKHARVHGQGEMSANHVRLIFFVIDQLFFPFFVFFGSSRLSKVKRID
jgi:hypothetical protein